MFSKNNIYSESTPKEEWLYDILLFIFSFRLLSSSQAYIESYLSHASTYQARSRKTEAKREERYKRMHQILSKQQIEKWKNHKREEAHESWWRERAEAHYGQYSWQSHNLTSTADITRRTSNTLDGKKQKRAWMSTITIKGRNYHDTITPPEWF